MLQKYTKFSTAQNLVKVIQANQKDEHAMHIMMSVFKKPLSWVEERFKREGLLNAIHKIDVRRGPIEESLSWIFTIKEAFFYYQMPFRESEFVTFNDWNKDYVRYQDNGLYAVLTQKHAQELVNMQRARDLQAIKKFTKSNIFYPYYLEDPYIQEFVSLIRVKRLNFNSTLNWKAEDGSHKLGVIFRGVVSIQYRWKRKIEIAQLTKGMYITNNYVKDQLQEIQDLQFESVEEIKKKPKELPRFKYVSKSDDTIILIFNVRLINEEPFNVNPEILPLVKKNFQKYVQKLQLIKNFDDYKKLHRNKSSIKEELKKKQIRKNFKRNISQEISKTDDVTSPVVRTFRTLEIQTSPFETVKSITVPEPARPFSKTVFTSISPIKYHRSHSSQAPMTFSSRRIIHNTWVEETSKKKPNLNSFSTLQTMSTYHPSRHKKQTDIHDQVQKEDKAAFFVPDQFVKRKLRMKYQGLVNKVKDMDLTVRKNKEVNLSDKMQNLQDYIESKRIVRINNAKKKFKLLRDKVQY